MMQHHSIPSPFGKFLQRVRDACGGRIPFRAAPAGFVIGLWGLDVTDDEREHYQAAAAQWGLSAAFACVDDITRWIAMRPEVNGKRGDPS